MKNITLIVLFCFYSLSNFASPIDSTTRIDSTQNIVNDEINNSIAAAIGAGDAKKLAFYFSASIDLTLPNTDGTYSKSQAEMIIMKFFSQYPPDSFKLNQQGSSNEGSQFAIGTYSSKSVRFRTYFLVKKVSGISQIQQLQFEKE